MTKEENKVTAREDAQPVAWRVTNKATGHEQLFWRPLADLPFNRERFSTEPLYTHPAPDALRLAVEDAIKQARWIENFDATTSGEREAIKIITEPLHQALAALQAESSK